MPDAEYPELKRLQEAIDEVAENPDWWDDDAFQVALSEVAASIKRLLNDGEASG